jgi:hypothetical protein
MKQTPNSRTEDLIEALAEIEHEQWMHWSKTVAVDVADVVRSKWQRSWVDYADLEDNMQEADRVWARKVVLLLRQRKLI